jgi:Tol biopolymer transport system component/DNA-binding winged helix-turn-helix (wHTH) protein
MRGGRICFEKFELEVENFQLRCSSRPVRLERIPMELLILLAGQAGRLVTREEILAAIWGKGSFLDVDNAINTAVRKIRRALHDHADQPRYIETVPGKGYRFVAEVKQVAGEAAGASPVNPLPFSPPTDPMVDGPGTEKSNAPILESSWAPPSGSGLASPLDRTSPGTERASAGSVGSGEAIRLRVPATSRSRLLGVAVMVTVLSAAAAVAFLFRAALPPPKVTSSTQLTKDGRAKATMVTDGSRIYFSYSGYGNSLYQVSTAGGDSVPFPTSLPDPIVMDISPDRSQLLVANPAAPEYGQDFFLWLCPVLGGAPRRLGNMSASLRPRGDRGRSPDAAWSPDGREVAYVQRNSLWRARIDGTESKKIVSVAANEVPNWPRWSPDGRRLRFSVQTRDDHSSLWEVTADGSNLHRLLPGWSGPSFECCGSWTPDGSYFVFQSERGGSTNIWAVREKASIFRKAGREPVQLTTGPLSTYGALPGSDGKKLFVIAAKVRGELVRFDSASRQFTDYLSGISAMGVNFSGDGKWITYVAYPEGTLWRSKADGSELLQLTFPPLFVIQPRWSPDGTRIAFMGQEPGKLWCVYVISAAGGVPEQPVPGDHRGLDPNWSPDGNALLFGRKPEAEPRGSLDLEILDLRTHALSKIPDSQELWSPRWSRDGRHILALPRAGDRLLVFDVKTRNWTELAKIGVGYPEWSRDGTYISFLGIPPAGGPRGLFRVGIRDGKLEEVVSLKDFRRAPGWGDWHGLAFDDSPLFLRDAGIQDIYALDWRAQ